jgi:hypothetical protein
MVREFYDSNQMCFQEEADMTLLQAAMRFALLKEENMTKRSCCGCRVCKPKLKIPSPI